MIKTRLQSAGKYSGPLDCLRKIYTTEGGIIAFYRGLGANLIGVIPEKSIKLVLNYTYYRLIYLLIYLLF